MPLTPISRSRLSRTLTGVGAAVCALVAAATLTGAPAPSAIGSAATSGGIEAVAVGQLRPVAAGSPLLRRVRPARQWIRGDGGVAVLARGTRFRPRGTVAAPPWVRARSWVVADLDTGQMLGKKRPRRRLPQASTIKLLSALTAVETVPARPRHRVTAWEQQQTCTCVGLLRRHRYNRHALLAGMLLPSGNDAAEALAGSHPGGRLAFYAAMNAKAAELGATDTRAGNASGLTAPGSHSSARDLVLLLNAALAEPRVAKFLDKPSAVVATRAGLGARRVWHGTDYVTRYPGSAGKSGYTTPAKNTLVVATDIGGRRIAVATMGAPGGYSTSGARALTEWAAENRSALASVGRLPQPRR